eukprot:1499817-Rhodomonas_salina.1
MARDGWVPACSRTRGMGRAGRRSYWWGRTRTKCRPESSTSSCLNGLNRPSSSPARVVGRAACVRGRARSAEEL